MSAVKLADAKTHLKITNDSQTGELQGFIDSAESVIAHRVGPLEATTFTTPVVSHGGRTLVLPVRPVLSLTSITSSGIVVPGAVTDLEAGIVTLADGARFPSGDLVVSYEAGRTELPADLRMAILELVRHFWETQRGPTRRPGSTPSDSASNTVPGAAYLLPFRVEQLLVPYAQSGIA